MKVRLLLKDTIEEAAEKHGNGKIHFKNLLKHLKYADWNRAEDITTTIKGNLLGNGSDRVVFDLGGNGSNSYRVICKYAFGRKMVRLYILWIGTHEQYNSLSMKDKLTVSDF